MKFAVLDLETTGLDVYPGAILEVSVSIMDTDFNTIEEFSSPVYHNSGVVEPLLNDWTRKTHSESGLLEECSSPKALYLHEIEEKVLNLFSTHFPNEKVVLVGNSIHFDRKWIDLYMPLVSQILHHRMLDVSALWEYMRMFRGVKRPINGEVAHRGLPDTKMSAKLLQQFGEYVT